jgi:hypothetical protein
MDNSLYVNRVLIVFQDGANLEGASLTAMDEFLRLNDNLTSTETYRIKNMEIGDKISLGGGAQGIFFVERVNDILRTRPQQTERQYWKDLDAQGYDFSPEFKACIKALITLTDEQLAAITGFINAE